MRRETAQPALAKTALTGLLALALAGCDNKDPDSGPLPPSEPYQAMLETWCVDCHNEIDFAGDIAFDTLDLDNIRAHQQDLETAVNRLRGRLMPPAGAPQPEQEEIDALVAWLETAIDTSVTEQHVSHVPVQRLNRTEFAASVKGLIGVDIDPEILPPEIEVEGFDNIANALSASPSFLKQYISAARLAAARAVGSPVPKFAMTMYPFDDGDQRNHRPGFPLGTRGGMAFTHVFMIDGEYRFNILDVDAGLYPRGVQTAGTLVILIDGAEVARRDIGGPEDLELADRDGPVGRAAVLEKVSEIPAWVEAGSHEVIVTFIDRAWSLSNDINGGGPVTREPILGLGVEVEGPFESGGLSMSDSRRRIFVCEPESATDERACAEQIATALATRAFRRPVSDDDLEWLMPFYETGRATEGGFDAGVRDLVTAVLASPDFMYRAIQSETDTPQRLSDFELASRLSFFLWSQGPDETLIELATNDELSDPNVMAAQVERMLDDDRAWALIDNFALAWLNLDELEQVDPDIDNFSVMRDHFEAEIRLFLGNVLLENRPAHELLSSEYTYLNDALARHYGVDGVHGSQFRRVQLTDPNRFGLLGKGAVLLRTSYGDRTSPVLRGAWVLDRIMGTPPTPPPPDVVTDLSIIEGEVPTTVRARLESHRDNPNCQSCHGLIDPPGLALENFDNTGRWRTFDAQAQAPIDTNTTLSSGIAIDGPVALREYLISREDQLPTTLTKRLMMYALNREIEYLDMPAVRKVVHEAADDDYTLAAIITGIANSDLFRQQGPDTSHQGD